MENIFNKPDNTQFVSFDEIESAFKTPTQRQDYYEPKPDPNPPMGDLSHLADPTGDAFSDFERMPDEPDAQVDHAHAMKTGERIARLIDTGIDFTLSNFVARNGESYRADERDLMDIAEAWGEVSEEHNWNIGPEWTLIILYAMVYGPLVKQAITDRRLAEMEARQAAMEAQQQAMQQQQQAMQQQLNTIQMKQQQQPETPAANGNPNPNPTPSPFAYQPAKQ